MKSILSQIERNSFFLSFVSFFFLLFMTDFWFEIETRNKKNTVVAELSLLCSETLAYDTSFLSRSNKCQVVCYPVILEQLQSAGFNPYFHTLTQNKQAKQKLVELSCCDVGLMDQIEFYLKPASVKRRCVILQTNMLTSYILLCAVTLFFLTIVHLDTITHPHLRPVSHSTQRREMLTCCSYCLPATLLTSKPGSPLCLRRNGGTTAASLHCFAMVNYDCRLEHLPNPPDTRAGVVREGGGASCSSTAHYLVLFHYITCPFNNRDPLCILIQGYTCWVHV